MRALICLSVLFITSITLCESITAPSPHAKVRPPFQVTGIVSPGTQAVSVQLGSGPKVKASINRSNSTFVASVSGTSLSGKQPLIVVWSKGDLAPREIQSIDVGIISPCPDPFIVNPGGRCICPAGEVATTGVRGNATCACPADQMMDHNGICVTRLRASH